MSNVIQEMKDNLCKIGEFELVDHINNAPSAEWSKALEYTRYLVAIHGSREALHRKIRSDIVSYLWGLAAPCDDGSYLRLRILIRVEQLVRECSDIADIEVELMTLAATWDASFEHFANLHRLSQLVVSSDFEELRRSLPSTNASTKSYVQVFGRAFHYFKMADMTGIDYAEVLMEDEL